MKKIISVILTAVMLLSAVPVMADTDSDDDIMVLLSELKIMVGDGDGNLRLDDDVSRAEFAKISVASSTSKNTVASGLKVSPFKDVTYEHWSAPYIKAAVSAGIVAGYVDGTFKPDNNVSYEEAITMMLKVLGYTDDDFGVSWPYGQIGLAENLEITKNVDAVQGDILTRRQVANLVYNTLDTKMKDSSSKLISIFDCEIIEDVTIIASNNEDSSIGMDKIYTTAGTYEYDDNFDSDYVGRRGDMVVKNGDDFVSFTPRDQEVEEYQVTNVVGNDLILDGNMMDINSNTTIYYKSQTYTYATAVSQASTGDTFRVYLNKNGSIDYALLIEGGSSSGISTNALDRYVIYSQLSDAIVCYKNGAFTQIDVKDSTTCYRDSVQSTYGSVKSEMAMGDILYIKYDGSDIDYLSYEKGSMEGPVKVTSSEWMSAFDTNSSTTVMRGGTKVTSSAIQINDIIYYSSELNMVLAYTDKVTGVYESASPSKDAPTTVTISGKEYSIEGVDAFNALSSSGSFKYGDTITALLGRNGDIAGVVTSDGTSTSSAVGYVTEAGKKDFTNANGTTYSSYYIKLVSADAVVNEYATTNDYSGYIGTVCKVAFSDGKASVTKQTSNTVSGIVDGTEYTIGSYKFADNVKILDTVVSDLYDVALYKSVYPQRLDGLTIASSSVLYCAKNSSNEITEMILKNVTGDAYSYGVFLSRANGSSGYVYTIDVDGTQLTYSTTMEMASKVGCKVALSNGTVERAESLKSYSGTATKLTSTTITIGGQQYKLSDRVAVYLKTSTLMKIPIDDAINGDYKLTAYYDKTESSGGRVRVIIAE
ncbi:MAG: S-layer homology domain-containing protein [Oscillospiraceae bacterium]|nr:S-layer homology domain-containing protein [Oscillospiraceae bacterium]